MILVHVEAGKNTKNAMARMHKTSVKSRHTLVSAVHLFLFRNNSVLLLRRYNTGYEDGNYSVIAGHLDGNESITTAMAREAQEEAGIKIDPKDLRVVHVMHRRSPELHYPERIDFFLTTDVWKGKERIMEKDKCDELAWYPINALPTHVIPYVKTALQNARHALCFSEYGWKKET